MEEVSHKQWVYYDVNHRDYRISLNKETFENIRNWMIISSKIVYLSDDDCKKFIQKKILITLLWEEERNRILKDTRIIHGSERICLKISSRLLDTLIEENLEDYEQRYGMLWDKIHFLLKDSKVPYNDKSRFDEIFNYCEKLNKVQPTVWDLFESEYINVDRELKDKL